MNVHEDRLTIDIGDDNLILSVHQSVIHLFYHINPKNSSQYDSLIIYPPGPMISWHRWAESIPGGWPKPKIDRVLINPRKEILMAAKEVY